MFTDRELLKLAAKAAGIAVVGFVEHVLDYDSPHYVSQALQIGSSSYETWNPIIHDGDALRLAVRLGFINPGRWPDPSWLVAAGMDWNTATRRAIVRAAAEIGRQMQEGGAA